jgi:hypothetical protein
LIQESKVHLGIFDSRAKETHTHPRFQGLKSTFLSRLQEAEFLKLISGFNPTFHTAKQIQDLKQKVLVAKTQAKEYRETIREKERDTLLLGNKVLECVEELQKEKEELIHVIGQAREAEVAYNGFMNLVHPDQAIVEDLLQKEDEEKQQLLELEALLMQRSTELNKNRSLLDKEMKRAEMLSLRKVDAEKREQEAIHLSKTKDPQMEELGKWYKETLGLLHALNDIEEMIVHSDNRIEIIYSGSTKINATFELSRDYVDVQVFCNSQ